jgi:hypothetical protein
MLGFADADKGPSVNYAAALLTLRLARELESEGSCSRMRSCSVPRLGSAAEWLRTGEKWGVDNVHTFAVGLDRMEVGSGRIPHIFASP